VFSWSPGLEDITGPAAAAVEMTVEDGAVGCHSPSNGRGWLQAAGRPKAEEARISMAIVESGTGASLKTRRWWTRVRSIQI
jgi:hypothetical protein